MASAYTPFLILGGMAYVNDWMAGEGATHFEPLLAGGIAAMFAGFAGNIGPDAAKVVSMIGWIAVASYFVIPGKTGTSPGMQLLGYVGDVTAPTTTTTSKKG